MNILESAPAGPAKSNAPRVKARADVILQESGLWANPYFEDLQNATMTREGFFRSQAQFYFAVAFFSRPLAGLVARTPDYPSRIDILHNVVEEHGDFQPAKSHAATFLAFLHSLGVEASQARSARASPAVHAFNSVLFSACLLEELELGVAAVGIVEYAFATISARIGQSVLARGWVAEDRLVHYGLHAELDQRHAEEFFAILEPKWSDAAQRQTIERGLALGAHIFDRLYCELSDLAGPPPALRKCGRRCAGTSE